MLLCVAQEFSNVMCYYSISYYNLRWGGYYNQC